MSEQLRSQLIKQEGVRLEAYKDSEGYWTIGIGRLIDTRKGGKISMREALDMLDNDIYEKMKDVDNAFPWSAGLNQARYDVLVNMSFNMGTAGLKTFRKMLAAAQAGAFNTAADEMLDSKWARQVGMRSAVLSDQMRNGTYA